MINQVQIDRMHFSLLSITQDERRGRDENFIPLGCLIHVSPLASRSGCLIHVSPLACHVRDAPQ